MAKGPRGKVQLSSISGMNLADKSLKEALDLYWDRKIAWIELAPFLDKTEQNYLDWYPEAKQARLKQVVNAYRLLKIQRPDYLAKDLTGVTLPIPSTLVYLLTIYRWSQNKDKEDQLKDNLDKVLSGVYKEPQIRILAKRAKAERNGKTIKEREDPKRGESITITPLDKVKGDLTSLEAFECGLKSFNFMIDAVLERNSYTHLRSLYAKQCLDLSTRLNCIGDKEFHDLWKQRKEIQL